LACLGGDKVDLDDLDHRQQWPAAVVDAAVVGQRQRIAARAQALATRQRRFVGDAVEQQFEDHAGRRQQLDGLLLQKVGIDPDERAMVAKRTLHAQFGIGRTQRGRRNGATVEWSWRCCGTISW
jgi:hypothetical protein